VEVNRQECPRRITLRLHGRKCDSSLRSRVAQVSDNRLEPDLHACFNDGWCRDLIVAYLKNSCGATYGINIGGGVT
jgi:hypothetical protein